MANISTGRILLSSKGQWLTLAHRSTHTGAHNDYGVTNDINAATLFSNSDISEIPGNIDWVQSIPARAVVERTITILEGAKK